jgi:ankyrin repeat protein/mono/diheme cytochrome c family protein
MRRVLVGVLASFAVLLRVAAQSPTPAPVAKPVDYVKDVKPLLAQNCYGCHGPDVQQSGLRLDLRQNALRGGDYGPVIIPGKSAESKLIRRLVDGDGGLQMPPTGALQADEIATIRAWIDQGAEFRNDVAEEAPPAPIDPRLAALVAAVRSEPRERVAALLAANPDLINAPDAAGSTLLHHAAAFARGETFTLLIDAGANVNARNRRRATPLHWALDDEAKIRALVEHGADVNAKDAEGRTALYQAASLGHALPALTRLLKLGADPNLAIANGRTPLMAAAGRADVDAMRALLDAKAAVDVKNGAGETALILAAGTGSTPAVAVLLDRGADARARTKRDETALGNAATAGSDAVIKLLLDHGAEVNVRNIRGYSALMLAASSDAVPASVVKLLLAAGADPTFKADYDESAADLAAKRGDTEVSRLLGGKPPRAAAIAVNASPRVRSLPDAVFDALTMAEKQSFNFVRIAGCNSCHSQDLPSAANGYAHSRGLRTPREIPQLPQSMMPPPERIITLGFVSAPSLSWELVDFGMNGVPPTPYTDAAVRTIEALQAPDGSWSANESRRPPMNAGEFQAAATCIYALRHYAPKGHEERAQQAVARAVAWLERSTPHSTQDRAFHALALAWANDGSDAARRSAQALVALQRPDGGWSQFAGIESDAYATGQALFALAVAGRMSPSADPYRKGIEYLLKTQAADGTWHVKTRSIWLQPYFESGFPYGRDQFISTAGTAWAAMALSVAAPRPGATQQQ